MAKASKPSLENAIILFQDVMQRALLSDYFHVNKTLLSKNPKGNTIVVSIDQDLWNGLIETTEFKDKIKEFDLTDSDNLVNIQKITYIENTDDWLELDSDILYSGKVIKLTIEKLEYELNINKNVIPLKLKKAEFNNISYKVFPDMTLAIRKRFVYPLDNCSFDIIRLFQII